VHEGFWWGKQGQNHLEDLAVDGRILNVSYKIGWGVERSDSGWGQLVGICEHGNEPSGSIKCEDFD